MAALSEESNSTGHEGAGSQSFVHLSLTQQSHPDTSVYLRKNGKICTDWWLADETGWVISFLPGVILIFCVFGGKPWALISRQGQRYCMLKKLLYFNSSRESQWIISGYMCQWDIFITKCPLVWIIYYETIITTTPVENYMVMQHWKEFGLDTMPCRSALIPLNLIVDMLLNLSTKGITFVVPNIHLLSMHKPKKGPETYI